MVSRLLIFTLLAQAAPARATSPEIVLGRAPPRLEWPQGLPEPILNADGSVTLPGPLAAETAKHLIFAEDEYPKLCQQHLDEQRHALDEALRESERLRVEEGQDGFPGWAVTTGILGGVILGIIGGLALGNQLK